MLQKTLYYYLQLIKKDFSFGEKENAYNLMIINRNLLPNKNNKVDKKTKLLLIET